MSRRVVVPNNELLDDVSKIIASGERVILLTKGQSMSPFIVGNRDSVELSPVVGDLVCGDILLAKISLPTPRYVIHRVVKISDVEIILMGDGNLVGVERCRKEDVVARITSIITPHKTIDPNSRTQRRYATIWRYLLPLRRYLLALWRLYGRVTRK